MHGTNTFEEKVEEKMDKITLHVKVLKKEVVYTVQIPENCTVDELKTKIEEVSSIPSSDQRILFLGKVLKSGNTLKDYNVSDGKTVHLIVRASPVVPNGASIGHISSSNTASSADNNTREPRNTPTSLTSSLESVRPLARSVERGALSVRTMLRNSGRRSRSNSFTNANGLRRTNRDNVNATATTSTNSVASSGSDDMNNLSDALFEAQLAMHQAQLPILELAEIVGRENSLSDTSRARVSRAAQQLSPVLAQLGGMCSLLSKAVGKLSSSSQSPPSASAQITATVNIVGVPVDVQSGTILNNVPIQSSSTTIPIAPPSTALPIPSVNTRTRHASNRVTVQSPPTSGSIASPLNPPNNSSNSPPNRAGRNPPNNSSNSPNRAASRAAQRRRIQEAAIAAAERTANEMQSNHHNRRRSSGDFQEATVSSIPNRSSEGSVAEEGGNVQVNFENLANQFAAGIGAIPINIESNNGEANFGQIANNIASGIGQLLQNMQIPQQQNENNSNSNSTNSTGWMNVNADNFSNLFQSLNAAGASGPSAESERERDVLREAQDRAYEESLSADRESENVAEDAAVPPNADTERSARDLAADAAIRRIALEETNAEIDSMYE
eukprot:g4584.t1